MEAQLPEAKVGAGWQQMLEFSGEFQEQGEPQERQIGDMSVIDVPLTFANELLIGRVAYNGQAQVAGLFILQPAAAGWPVDSA